MNFEERINNLRKDYLNYPFIHYFKSTDLNNEKIEISDFLIKNNHDESNKLNEIMEHVYKQEWKRLNIINKRIKIEEFINKLKKKYNNIDIILKELIELLNNKKLLNKYIQYDKINGEILDILCLNKKNNKLIIKTKSK
mgnify:CR=1 FL=1|tara:strand:- start:5015 stop:5431 length:417 start_codon:yes stop_codon:yes gene_type:complete